jgi:hypothetical protein
MNNIDNFNIKTKKIFYHCILQNIIDSTDAFLTNFFPL